MKPELPKAFKDRILRQFPIDGPERLALLDGDPRAAILTHPQKFRADDLIGSSVPWCPHGILLTERPAYALDPLWHAGAYYVMESSSMIVAHMLIAAEVPKSGAVLDLCAAPGGKSMIAAAHLYPAGLLVSNEIHPLRASILLENVTKQGLPVTAVTRTAPSAFEALGPVFDAVLCDAPCSGEGLFRKDPDARNHWHAGLPAICANRQREILVSALAALKGGGTLIYSTCTIATEENEDIVQWLTSTYGMEELEIAAPSAWPVERAGTGSFRFWPGRGGGEGFFVSALRMPGTAKRVGRAPKGGQMQRVAVPELPFVPDSSEKVAFFLAKNSDILWSAHAAWLQLLNQLDSVAKVLAFPLEAGRLAGRTLIPAHHLAMCAPASAPRTELSLTDALAYLRKQEVTISAPAGRHLVAYKGRALGWVNHLGNRTNNGYPKDWKLRSQ